MANESLKRLKDTLVQAKKYTGLNINTDSLDKLRASANQMIDIMNQTRPGDPNSTTGNISGTTCGSFVNLKYTKPTVSLGELEEHINKMPIEACSAVITNVCSCVSRIYINPCDCENRTSPICETREACVCQGNMTSCECYARGECSCKYRFGCKCQGRDCGWYNYYTCNCNGREVCDCLQKIGPSCVGRASQPLCPCNGRCSCNTEKRFT